MANLLFSTYALFVEKFAEKKIRLGIELSAHLGPKPPHSSPLTKTGLI
jgi:hypothetical protein